MTSDQAQESRYAPGVERVYRNDQIEVTWEPRRCIHFQACIRGSLAAFNPHRRPWIDIDAEPPERIAEIVARCPTGALHALWPDGRPAESPREPASIVPTLDGPLFFRGRVQILDREGNVVREDTRVALCRCGQSQNKPFCDDSHYRTGFESNDPDFGQEPDDPDTPVR